MSEPELGTAASKPEPAQSSGPTGHPVGRGRYLLTELLIVTVGVLIALSVDSLRQWREHVALVDEARRNIAQEIRDNAKDLDNALGQVDTRRKQLDDAITLADDVLAKRPSQIHHLELAWTVADISDANWKSAERTGALTYMEYAEVQRYSRLYDLQALFADHQRQQVERVAAALSAITADDPEKASIRDTEVFRDRVLALRGDLIVVEQIGHALKEAYTTAGAK
jgi:chromosome segregation ATPase